MKRLRRLALILAGSMVPLGAHAQTLPAPGTFEYYFNGTKILNQCTHDPHLAVGYVLGILDQSILTNVVAAADGHEVAVKHQICPPREATPQQAGDIVCKFVGDNDAIQNLPAASLTTIALMDAWPCK